MDTPKNGEINQELAELVSWDFGFQISDFRFQISDFRFQISDFRFQISGLRRFWPHAKALRRKRFVFGSRWRLRLVGD